MKIIILIWFIIFASIQGINAEIDTGFKFLKINPHASARALADTYIAVVDDAGSIKYNPAGLGLMGQKQVIISDLEWINDFRYINLIYGQNVFSGGCGISFSYFGIPPFIQYDAQKNIVSEDIRKYDLCISMGYGQRFFIRDYYMGFTLKYLHSVIMQDNASAIAMDLGLRYDFSLIQIFQFSAKKNSTFSFAVKNIGYNLTSVDNRDDLPFAVTGGFNYLLYQNKINKLSMGFEVKQYIDNDFIPSVGCEYWFFQVLAFRAGYGFNHDMTSLSCGLGGKYMFDRSIISLDIAYTPAELGEHIFNGTLSYKFGKKENNRESIKKKINYSISDPNRNTILINITNNRVLFDFDEYKIKSEAYPELDQIVEFIEEQDYKRVFVNGYADEVGDEYYNLKLSLIRAKAVAQYIIDNGVDDKKVTSYGHGESSISVKHCFNRRCDIVISIWKKGEKEKFQYYYYHGMDADVKEGYEKAIKYWSKALLIDPQNQEIKNRIETAKKNLKKKKEALNKKKSR